MGLHRKNPATQFVTMAVPVRGLPESPGPHPCVVSSACLALLGFVKPRAPIPRTREEGEEGEGLGVFQLNELCLDFLS